MKFLFKRIIKNLLKPIERDQLNFIVSQFPWKRGMPSIQFDVTSSTKNFSMSLMQQISVAFLYALNLSSVSNEVVRFWADVDGFIRDLFEPTKQLENVKKSQDQGVELLERAKVLIPKIEGKNPHNIHAALEYLFVDMPIFVLSEIMAGTAEEHKHQVYKSGGHFTDPTLSCAQLMERDLLVSTLRHFIHGGSSQEEKILCEEFRNATHPHNEYAPHPLLLTLTNYHPLKEEKMGYPSMFYYQKHQKFYRSLTSEESNLFANALEIEPSALKSACLPSKRYVIDEKTNFHIGDVVSMTRENGSDYLRVNEFLTVFYGTKQATFVNGYNFNETGFNPRLGKVVYLEGNTKTGWIFAKLLLNIVVCHHNCVNCKLNRVCDKHANCNEDCPYSSFRMVHTQCKEVVIHEFKNVFGK